MCGIVGIWGAVDEGRLRTMTERLRHRGPDDAGIWLSPTESLGLAHRRLSIIDLEGGHQPVFNETGEIVTVFNGEIYNYKELREALLARGHRFSTQTDTEVIVHLYEDLGPDFVAQLRGMFAIAIWDAPRRQLMLVRDRVGKKPLYYSQTAGEFLFASEIKGLVAAARGPLELDEQVLADYLAWGQVHPPATIYRQLRSIEPGQWAIVRDQKIARHQRYWRLAMRPKVALGFADAVEQADELIRDAVRLRLRSDVPVGAFLSGGIDSGIITAMAGQQYPGSLVTVTIGFDDDSFDERPLARQVAERYATDHQEVVVKPEVAADLPAIAAAYDQPFGGPSAVPSYYVARAARSFVKVVLNGDGGDELFAGYRRYIAARINRWLQWADGRGRRFAWRALSRLLPVPRSFRTNYAFVHRLVRGMSTDPATRYLAWSVDVLTEAEKRALCGSGSWLERTEPGVRLVHPYLAELEASGPVDRMLGTDFATILPHDLLVKMDIACMAHGLEARSPLLDHVLVDTVSHYPETVKLSGIETKPILRRLSRRYLPDEVCTAPKRGFEVPLVRWLRNDLRPLCEDIVLSRNGLLVDMFHRPALERMVRDPQGVEPARWARRLWTMLMLGMWDRYVRPT